MIKRNRQLGLTLTEMMLALAITGMLLVAALHVTTVVSKCSAAQKTDGAESVLQSQLQRLLNTDIQHAESYRVTEDGVELRLRSAFMSEDMKLQHLSSSVFYRTVVIDERSWLVRIQRQGMDELTELVAVDVEKINVDSEELGQWQDMPGSFAVEIEFSGDEEEAPMMFNFVLQ